MNIRLVVVRAFGRHARGDVIDDPGEAEQVLQSQHANSVVRVLAAERATSGKEG